MTPTLDNFGVEERPSVREPGRNSQGERACINCNAPLFDEDADLVPVPTSAVANNAIRSVFNLFDVEAVETRGWECEYDNIIFPRAAQGPHVPGYDRGLWVGLKVRFDDEASTERWIPVLRDDLPAPLLREIDDVLDKHAPTSARETATDGGFPVNECEHRDCSRSPRVNFRFQGIGVTKHYCKRHAKGARINLCRGGPDAVR